MEQFRIKWINYNKEEVFFNENATLEDIVLTEDKFAWFNLSGLSDLEKTKEFVDHFGIDQLLHNEVLNFSNRPTYFDMEEYFFFSLKIFQIEDDYLDGENIAILLGKNAVFSFKEKPGNQFEKVYERLLMPGTKIRSLGSDFLFIRLIESVVGRYREMIDGYEDKLEELEDQIFEEEEIGSIKTIYTNRKNLRFFRRYIVALREALIGVLNEDEQLIKKKNLVYVEQLLVQVNLIKDLSDGLIEGYNGLVDAIEAHNNNRLNQIMKVLTILSSIFIPLGFLAGVYGMNFEKMPGTANPNGFYLLCTAMGLISLGMLYYFRRKRWL